MEALAQYTRRAIGQTDYAELTGQVVDQHGNGLQALYFYIDKDSNPISQDFYTPPAAGMADEPAGTYHLSYPINIDTANTFVDFASYDNFTPVVKSLAELQTNPTVTLEDTSKKPSYIVPVIVAGGLLALGLSNKQKKVGALNLKQRYQQLNPKTKKIIVYTAGGLGAFFLIRYLLAYKPNPQQQAELTAAQRQLESLAAVGILPSYTLTQFQSMANAIVSAVDECGTDEDTIFRQFNYLKNDADLYTLIKMFGVAKYKGCFQGSYFSYLHKTLSEAITTDLTASEVGQINSILASKNIQYYF
jgi:hypothetical protein